MKRSESKKGDWYMDKKRNNLQHGSVEHVELCLAMGPRHGLLGTGSRVKKRFHLDTAFYPNRSSLLSIFRTGP
ncbi:hypothetical protein BDR22DRAFT_871550 [Usnea florida]